MPTAKFKVYDIEVKIVSCSTHNSPVTPFHPDTPCTTNIHAEAVTTLNRSYMQYSELVST